MQGQVWKFELRVLLDLVFQGNTLTIASHELFGLPNQLIDFLLGVFKITIVLEGL